CRRAAYVQATSESVLPPGLRGSSATGAGGGVCAGSAERDDSERDEERPRPEPPRREVERPPRLRPPRLRLRLRARGSSKVSPESVRASSDMTCASGCEVQIVATRPKRWSSAAMAWSVASL